MGPQHAIFLCSGLSEMPFGVGSVPYEFRAGTDAFRTERTRDMVIMSQLHIRIGRILPVLYEITYIQALLDPKALNIRDDTSD